MKLILVIVSLTVFAYAIPVKISIPRVQGYYWREYIGELPDDAVPGGLDKYGKITYIGQALHIFPPNGKLIPGKIDADKKEMHYAWDANAYVVTKNVKILCSQTHENFKWIETDIAKIKALPQRDFVLGGYDTNYPLFIGRKHVDGEIVLGKVTLESPYDAFGYTINGKAVFEKTTFEVLSYNKTNQVFIPKAAADADCSVEKIVNINIF